MSTEKLVLIAVLTALVAILSYLGNFIPLGIATISLTLIPTVLGAALCGPATGAWLGGVSGIVFLMTPAATAFLGLHVFGTIVTVMIKGIVSGFCAGLVYKALERFNRYLAVMAAAIVCPIVNTGIYYIGTLIFFLESTRLDAASRGLSVFAYLIFVAGGLNFVFELLSNIIFSPAIVRLLDIKLGKKK